MTPIEHALQAVVVVLVLVKLWALGRKYRWGWALAVGAEVPWLTLAVLWRSWGMCALSVLYGGMSARNWYSWRDGPSSRSDAERSTAQERDRKTPMKDAAR